MKHDHPHAHGPGGAAPQAAHHDHTQPSHSGHHAHHERMVRDFKRRFWICLILTAPILGLSPGIQSLAAGAQLFAFPGRSAVLLVLSTVVFFYGGLPFLTGMADELKRKRPGMMTLIGAAITVSFVYSAAVVFGLPGKMFFWELATLIDIMLVGHWIEMRSVMGASRALEELVKLMPSTAHRLREDGAAEDVPVDRLERGDRVLVKPGEKFPTDGVVVEGRSTADEALLTGETRPVAKGPGDPVIGGAINGDGALVIRVEKVGGETFLSQVISMVKRAQESKSRTQDLANRVAMWLTIVAISAGTATFLVWLWIGNDVAFALERMVTVMVITCPHALGLAVPLVVAVSTSIAAAHGLLIRNRAAFERARAVDAVVFDKTGTLTQGRFGVQAVVPFDDAADDEILRLAASLESRSEHPIASGIVNAARERNLSVEPPSDFQAVKGKGVIGAVGGRRVAVVSPGFLEERGIPYDAAELNDHYAQGRTVVFVLVEERPVGAVALGDTIRPDAKHAVAVLQKMGVKCIMLTGDKEEVARAVSHTLGLDEYFAEVLPDQKAEKIEALKRRGWTVAMTGDGINDAPALATADVGIAVGAGTDVAVETADVILVRSLPSDVASIVVLARATYRKMIENLLWATGYNVVAIPLAAGVLAPWGVLLSPAAGAALMSLSTVIVAVNARMLTLKPTTPSS